VRRRPGLDVVAGEGPGLGERAAQGEVRLDVLGAVHREQRRFADVRERARGPPGVPHHHQIEAALALPAAALDERGERALAVGGGAVREVEPALGGVLDLPDLVALAAREREHLRGVGEARRDPGRGVGPGVAVALELQVALLDREDLHQTPRDGAPPEADREAAPRPSRGSDLDPVLGDLALEHQVSAGPSLVAAQADPEAGLAGLVPRRPRRALAAEGQGGAAQQVVAEHATHAQAEALRGDGERGLGERLAEPLVPRLGELLRRAHDEQRSAVPRGGPPAFAPGADPFALGEHGEPDDGAGLAIRLEHRRSDPGGEGERDRFDLEAVVVDGQPRRGAADADHPIGAARAGDALEAGALGLGEHGGDDALADRGGGRVDVEAVEVATHGASGRCSRAALRRLRPGLAARAGRASRCAGGARASTGAKLDPQSHGGSVRSRTCGNRFPARRAPLRYAPRR
jgi:hypothetical protein